MGQLADAGRGFKAKPGLFLIVGAMTLFVLWNNERFLLDAASPQWAHYEQMGWRLAPHGVAGVFALVAGALQFSERARRRGWHRHLGRLYVAAVFVAAPFAIWMAMLASPWFLLAFTIVQAGVWMLATAIGFAFARRRRFDMHREWMIRSYGVTLNFLEGRVLMAIPPIGAGGLDSVVLVNWGSLVLTLVGAELLIQWLRLRRPIATVAAPAK